MPKNKSCGYSVTHVTCGTIKFVLEHLGHLYYALQRMTFSGTASLVLRWTLCEVVKDISFPTCQLLSPDSVRKSYPRGGKLTFSRCLGVGNLPLAYIKMSNSPGSAQVVLGLFKDLRKIYIYFYFVLRFVANCYTYRPCHGFRRHLNEWANVWEITVFVWESYVE